MLKVKQVKAYALVDTDRREELKRRLTIKSTGKKPFTLRLYKETPQGIWIPRALVSDSNIKVERMSNWYLEFPMTSKVNLRPEQKDLKNSFLSALSSTSPYGGIINSKTGSGKTVTALDILATIGGRSLIVVPTSFLMGQWADRIVEFTNVKREEIGYIRQNRCDIQDKPISIGMLHSLAMKSYPEYVYTSFHNVIFDEIHRISSEVFSRSSKLFHAKYLYGLSATPVRKDGTDAVFKWSIGNVIAKSNRLTSKPKVILIPYRGADAHHSGCIFRGELSLGKYMNKLELSVPRTKLIAEVVFALYQKNEDVLLLSDRLQMLYNLKELLCNKGIPLEKIGLLTGEIKQPDKKIILGTYGSAGLGADIPRLSALVFATPRTDIEQAFGRVTRTEGCVPTVVDIVDIASPIMLKWMYKRLNFYKKYAQEVVNKINA